MDYLLYDGECPVCSRYVLWSDLRRRWPDIQLLNAREHPGLVSQLRGDGIEVNDTMVLSLDGEQYTGPAAMAKIAKLTDPSTARGKALRTLTRSPAMMRALYPKLVRGRKILLRLLGRSRIS